MGLFGRCAVGLALGAANQKIRIIRFRLTGGSYAFWHITIHNYIFIIPFLNKEEANHYINDMNYTFRAVVITRDLDHAHRVVVSIGMGVNSSQDCDPRVLLGGIKQNGIRKGLGDMGLVACFQAKAVYVI